MRSDVAKQRECVIERESGGELPLRDAGACVDWPKKFQRPNEMRRQSQQPSALSAGLEHEMQKPVLEVPEAAVHESRRSTRRATRKVVFLHQRGAQSAQGGVARDATPCDAATNDEQIELVARERRELPGSFFRRRGPARCGGRGQIVLPEVNRLRARERVSRSYQSRRSWSMRA
jgi:hypothetical protein